jgi:hypothetical protein
LFRIVRTIAMALLALLGPAQGLRTEASGTLVAACTCGCGAPAEALCACQEAAPSKGSGATGPRCSLTPESPALGSRKLDTADPLDSTKTTTPASQDGTAPWFAAFVSNPRPLDVPVGMGEGWREIRSRAPVLLRLAKLMTFRN